MKYDDWRKVAESGRTYLGIHSWEVAVFCCPPKRRKIMNLWVWECRRCSGEVGKLELPMNVSPEYFSPNFPFCPKCGKKKSKLSIELLETRESRKRRKRR